MPTVRDQGADSRSARAQSGKRVALVLGGRSNFGVSYFHASEPHNTKESMTYFLRTGTDLQLGLAQLIVADPRLKPVADKAGTFALRRREPGFSGLCAIVCGQQLSTASAAAIHDRLFAAFGPVHHHTVLPPANENVK